MRKTLVKTLMEYADDPRFVFLTGDLGYKALEPLRDKMGERFINAGIAEQNMVTTAAGLASCGDRPWCYSIAPFLYARAFEQIRNDVCQANRPVMLVGNGAGYGYGVMGPSHHALGDYGALLTLPNLRCLIPAFASDIKPMVDEMFVSKEPCYLRLGVAEEPVDYVAPAYAPWRCLSRKTVDPKKMYNYRGPVVVVVGSIVGTYVEALKELCSLWVVSELPSVIPAAFHHEFNYIRDLIIIEEHVEHGSLGNIILANLVTCENLNNIVHLTALGYPSGTYGSKEFHRKECSLDKDSLVERIQKLR